MIYHHPFCPPDENPFPSVWVLLTRVRCAERNHPLTERTFSGGPDNGSEDISCECGERYFVRDYY
jgi:hypothetical protein